MQGENLAHFLVGDLIGQGGMGKVYRAQDTRLGRNVALKVLPEEFVRDSERLARFEREARVLAQLQHENVAAIFGLEKIDDRPVLVMELVEGENLAARLGRGTLTKDEATDIALQIARGLEAAHEKGIVHRDLKPANIMLTAEGQVKILDFGLARAFSGKGAVLESDPSLSNSPTIAHALTSAGTILGTAAYMSPEQARGQAIDRRADIWAFGVILYELLTGQALFRGDTASDVLAAVLRQEVDWEILPSDPPLLAHLCRRCLERDPRRRLRDIGEARLALGSGSDSMLSTPAVSSDLGLKAPATGRSRSAWLIAAVATLAALAGGLWLGRGPLASTPPANPLVRSQIVMPEGVHGHYNPGAPGPVKVSPDGRHVAFAGQDTTGQVWLYVRSLSEHEAYRVPGTRSAAYPFWSPDSRTLAFFADNKLKRVDIAGGPVVTICDAANGKGGTWRADGTILFAPTHNTGIHRVDASGGEPQLITRLARDEGQRSHRFPIWLPGKNHFLYLAWHETSSASEVNSLLHVASLDGSEDRELIPCQTNASYAAGHIIYVVDRILMARPFSLDRLEFTGPAVPLEEDVLVLGAAHVGVFSTSPAGVLAFQKGSGRFGQMSRHWLEKDGTLSAPIGNPGSFLGFRIGPDGERFAFSLVDSTLGTFDVWLHDIARDLSTRFTFDSESEGWPIWSPDGKWLVYGSDQHGDALLRKPLSGIGQPDTILTSLMDVMPFAWSPDGTTICYASLDTTGNWDLWFVAADGSGEARPFRTTKFNERQASFSPDGRWVAYASSETGSYEVFIESVEPGEGRWRVSAESGAWPIWSPTGDWLYYLTQSGELLATAVEHTAEGLRLGRTKSITTETQVLGAFNTYDIDPVTGRVLLERPTAQVQHSRLALVTGWSGVLGGLSQ